MKGKKRGEFIQMVVYKVQGAHYHAIGLTEIGHTTIINSYKQNDHFVENKNGSVP